MNILIIGSGAVGIGIGTSLLSQNVNVSFLASKETAKKMKNLSFLKISMDTSQSSHCSPALTKVRKNRYDKYAV